MLTASSSGGYLRYVPTLLLLTACGNGARIPPSFVQLALRSDLDERVADAAWLMNYDMVAWVSSDAAVAEVDHSLLGREWFAWQDASGTWFAAYGRYDGEVDRYEAAAWYRVDAGVGALTPVRLEGTPDPQLADPMGRAIDTVWDGDPGVLALGSMAHNTFVRRTAEGIEVFVMPAWQVDGTLVIGNSSRFALDADGRTTVSREDYAPGHLRVRPGETKAVTLPCTTEIPTVFELFWARYYADDFESFVVRCGETAFSFSPKDRALITVTTAP